jgi:hypothetical protein
MVDDPHSKKKADHLWPLHNWQLCSLKNTTSIAACRVFFYIVLIINILFCIFIVCKAKKIIRKSSSFNFSYQITFPRIIFTGNSKGYLTLAFYIDPQLSIME